MSRPLPSRQPRNPAPPGRNHRPSGPSSSTRPLTSARSSAHDPENSTAALQRMEQAALVLGSWEMLALAANNNYESIPQTRLRIEKRLIGLDAAGEGSGEKVPNEWEDEAEVPWVEDEKAAASSARTAGGAGLRTGEASQKGPERKGGEERGERSGGGGSSKQKSEGKGGKGKGTPRKERRDAGGGRERDERVERERDRRRER
ncbi:hypothetical protein MMC13_005199 [Lambiella insularis]|nr:hypothetical protein [Lambiella insularis]